MAERRKLVLLVNSDQAVLDALQFALQLEGFCVHVHSGGAALLADPDLQRAGCVVLDERMKHMDGFMVLGALHERNISLPAIMLTSNPTERLKARADEVGVRSILEKPLLDNALVESLHGILKTQARTDT